MPGLVQRYKISSEYAELLSTAPAARRRAPRDGRWTSAISAAISKEAASWYAAAAPPLEDLQAVLRRFAEDQEFSQDHVFRFLRPLLVFGILFVASVATFQPHSFANHFLAAPRARMRDLGAYAALLAGVVLLGLVVLKTAIWCVAEVCNMILAVDRRRGEREGNLQVLPSGNVLLGLLM